MKFPLQRFAALFGCHVAISVTGHALNVVSIPLLHVETIVLAPFLEARWAVAIIALSQLTSLVRVVAGVYGFDQVFVALYMLRENVRFFPAATTLGWATAVVVIVIVWLLLFRATGRRCVRVHWAWAVVVLALMAGLKTREDRIKFNVVGSSAGYLFGQLRFSTMLKGAYAVTPRDPGPSIAHRAAQMAVERGQSFMLVLVESLSMPTNPSYARDLTRALATDAVLERFDLTAGYVTAKGATLQGEIRELCDGDLKDGLFGYRNGHCLPRVLQGQGYRTTAVHANFSRVYGREAWYPRIGFQELISSDSGELPESVESGRWGTLPDDALFRWISRNRAHPPELQFLYVLTISTHLPVRKIARGTERIPCERDMTEEACDHANNLQAVLQSLSNLIAEMSDTIVLVVGDHPPPFFRTSSRSGFEYNRVPYYVLKSRNGTPSRDARADVAARPSSVAAPGPSALAVGAHR